MIKPSFDFKEIPGYRGRYSIDRNSAVFSWKNGVIKKQTLYQGYRFVNLWKNNRQKLIGVHRLMLLAFVGPPPSGFVSDHKNRVRSDNRIENLRYVSLSVNNHNRTSVTNHGFKGVHFYPKPLTKPWSAEIKCNGKHTRSHYYRTAKEAAFAYDRMAKAAFGAEATTNKSMGRL